MQERFEAILRYGHDEDFVPNEENGFSATDAPAGSSEKIEVLRRRVELGQPLWHSTDRVDYSGLTGAIRPTRVRVGPVLNDPDASQLRGVFYVTTAETRGLDFNNEIIAKRPRFRGPQVFCQVLFVARSNNRRVAVRMR